MNREQEEIIHAFKNTYNPERKEPFAVYGTGINAEAVLTCCKEYPIAGVIDLAKTREIFCGFPVMPLDEVIARNIREIVVVARPSVHGIIYKRIRKWSEDNGVRVLDVHGNDIGKKIKTRGQDLPYFMLSYEDLEREIDSHDVISFDVFDTLLMRKVYEPTDVFALMDRELLGKFPFVFSRERKAAEQALKKVHGQVIMRESTGMLGQTIVGEPAIMCESTITHEPTIYQIYEYLARKHHLSEEEKQYLLSAEIEKEKTVLCVREKMKRCMEYCIRQGKKVYLVSDMYFPAELLGELLGQYGITGYTELLVSCDYQTSKPEKLFDKLKEKASGRRYLHIGDNKESDYDSPKRHGIDAFLVMPAVRMMECSAYEDVFIHLNSLPSRVMLGMLAAEVFQDPFALSGTRGIPAITDAGQFGYGFISPLVLSFTVWLFDKVRTKRKSLLLFSARDGWMLQKVFRYLAETWKLDGLPDDVYFMVSRKALEIVEKGKDKAEDKVPREKYLAYLKTIGFAEYEQVFYFDFMSRGTCQSLLESISGQKMQGIYFQKSVSGIASKDGIQVWPYFEENSAHEKDLRIFALCDFLECIFTSYDPSFNQIDENGNYLYEEEKRTEGQISALKEIHTGIFRYCSDFARIMPALPEDMPPKEFSDEVLRYTSSEYSRIEIPRLKEFMLDDWLGGDKNTGMDALA